MDGRRHLVADLAGAQRQSSRRVETQILASVTEVCLPIPFDTREDARAGAVSDRA